MREKIRATLLIKKLEDHVFTDLTDPDFAKKAMTADQVRAALGLLGKSLPDLKAMELSGNAESPLQIGVVERRIVDANPNT